MIIYGWGNFNRRNHSLVRGTCQSCGRQGYLRSYTSTRFITLYFIPVIPIGKHKILEECPHCKKARGMSFRQYRKLVKKELPQAIADYEASPDSKDAAAKAISASAFCQERASLRRIAPQISARFQRDEDTLLQLANAHSYLCLDDAAAAAYLDAVKVANSETAGAAAEAHMQFSALAKPAPPNRILQSLPVLIVPGIALFALVAFLQKSMSNTPDAAYLINGLEVPYKVRVNGRVFTLYPHRSFKTDAVHFGSNTIEPESGSLPIEPVTFEVSSDFSQRAFDDVVVVVNPDKAALIDWERTLYGTSSSDKDGFTFRISVGEPYYTFSDIDFVFKDFPQQIQLSGTNNAYRTRVDTFHQSSVTETLSALLGNELSDQARTYLQNMLRYQCDDAVAITAAQRLLASDDFLELAESHVHNRPIEIEWHRAYQTALEDRGDDVESAYRELLAESPEDATLLYLLGRVCSDSEESVRCFQKAYSRPSPTGYAANALAYHYLLECDYPAALDWAQKALDIDRDSENFNGMYSSALYANRNFERILFRAETQLSVDGDDGSALFDRIYCLAKLGREQEARQSVSSFASNLKRRNQLSPEQLESLSASYLSLIPIARSDASEYLATKLPKDDAQTMFRRALVAGNTMDALDRLKEEDAPFTLYDRMTLCILLERNGDAARANDSLISVVQSLDEGSANQRKWAKWLEGEGSPSRSEILHTCEDLSMHYLYVATLAACRPEDYAGNMETAHSLRFKDSVYSLALEPVWQ